MKKLLMLLCCLLIVLTTGCAGTENPYRVDTVVQIPVDPTDPPEATEASAPEEETTLLIETEPAATEAAKSAAASGTKSTSSTSGTTSKSSTKTSSSSGTKATEPAVTEPVVTEPPATQPPATEAPATEPPATEPPVTEPPATELPVTEPPVSEEPETAPPETGVQEQRLYDISGYGLGSLELDILEQINERRAEAGIPALVLDERLCAIASARAYEVSVSWNHTRPDGRSYDTVLSDYGYDTGAVSEHLLMTSGTESTAEIVAMWMDSENHAGLFLSEDFSAAGIGLYEANGFVYIACLLVG